MGGSVEGGGVGEEADALGGVRGEVSSREEIAPSEGEGKREGIHLRRVEAKLNVLLSRESRGRRVASEGSGRAMRPSDPMLGGDGGEGGKEGEALAGQAGEESQLDALADLICAGLDELCSLHERVRGEMREGYQLTVAQLHRKHASSIRRVEGEGEASVARVKSEAESELGAQVTDSLPSIQREDVCETFDGVRGGRSGDVEVFRIDIVVVSMG